MEAIHTPPPQRVSPPSPGAVDDAAWNAMTRDQTPLADAEWIRCYANAFGGSVQLHHVIRNGRVVAGVPLIRSDGLARVWTTQDNEHCPYRPIGGELDRDAARDLLESVLADAECVFFRRLHVESQACDALRAAADHLRMSVAFVQSDAGDARIALAGHGLPKKFAKDLGYQRRQLEKRGKLELAILTAPDGALDRSSCGGRSAPWPELASALDEAFHLEGLGWKGKDGSPIKGDPRTLRFYTELAHAAAARGRFALYTLRIDGKLVAFEYTLRGGGHIELLKISYDPAYEKHSPGQVLRMMLLEREVALGEIRYYHLGRPSPWKQRWATEIAPLCTLRIYGTTMRARSAYIMGPALRATLKQSPAVVKARDLVTSMRSRVLAARSR